MFGLLTGFAYLAHEKKQLLVAYGLGLLALAFLLEGFRTMMSGPSGMVTLIELLRYVAIGGGFSFLGYVSSIHGWRYYGLWRERRRREAEAFQLKVAAAKNAPGAASGKS